MIGEMIPIPRHAAPCQGPLNRSRRKRNDLPLLGDRKRQPSAGGNKQHPPDVLRCRADPSERGAAIRSLPCVIPKQRHATSAQPDEALTGPVLPALRQDRGFFISGIFKRRRHTLLILFRNQGYSVFTEECIFSSSVKESFSSLSIYGRLGIQILHTITIHG